MIHTHLDDKVKKWFAVCTKYKCEKFVARNLTNKGVENYLPMLKKIKVYASRRKEYHLPLINCYVFVNITKDEYVKVLETEYVFSLLKQGHEIIPIPEREINIMRQVVGEYDDVMIGNYQVCKGDDVEIIAGNLTGIRGKVTEIKGKNSVMIDLVTLGLQVGLSINKKQLRRLKQKVEYQS